MGAKGVFYDIISAAMYPEPQLPAGKDAPDHTVSRRIPKHRDIDVCSPVTMESKAARPDASKRLEDRAALYDYYLEVGAQGAIREEAMDACGLPHESGYPRLSELVFQKKLVPTGEKRKTRQGNLAAVLVADIHVVSV